MLARQLDYARNTDIAKAVDFAGTDYWSDNQPGVIGFLDMVGDFLHHFPTSADLHQFG